MKKGFWIIFFGVVMLADLTGIQWKEEQLEYIFKPLIVPVLVAYFLSQTNHITNGLKKWIFLALFFSWTGDILLMFQGESEIYFLAGLGSFLLAHIFYIVFFHQVRVRENIKSNAWLLLIVVIYYTILISWLSPYLGDKKIPVRLYGIAISFMFMLAMHMLFIKKKAGGNWMMWGALLFIISDSVLAINKFYHSFGESGIIIMLTYGLAQYFLTEGAVRYTRPANSN
jgi:uncharacterized membrane protein YhhN